MKYWYERLKQSHYFLGMAIGILIVLAHIIATYFSLNSYLDGNEYLFTPYTQWIDFNTGPWTVSLLLALPLLSALSTSQMVGDDLKSGFFWQIISQKSLIRYLSIEQLISFLGGFLTMVIPLLVDLVGMWCLLPKIIPDPILNANQPFLPNFTYLYQLYYSHPLALIWFYTLLTGITAGLFSLLAASISLYSNNRFLPLGLGFVLTMILNVMSSVLPHSIFSPVLISMGVCPVYLAPLNIVIITYIFVLILLMITNFIGGYHRASL